MNRRVFLWSAAILAASPGLTVSARADGGETTRLPEPDKSGGMPLMEALDNRRSNREFSRRELDERTLSNLLWAAWGVNRQSGKRTAPSAMNRREIVVYCVMEKGCFLYDADRHELVRTTVEDLRPLAGEQGFVSDAPLNLVYVADMNKQPSEFYAACNTGFIGQNVYLYCASAGLNTVVRNWIDKDALARAMGLEPWQSITLSQTVGYPG